MVLNGSFFESNFDLKHFNRYASFTLKALSLNFEAEPVLLRNCYWFGFFCPREVTLVMMVTMRREGERASTGKSALSR